MNQFIIEDLPYSFAKQRKVLKSVITPTAIFPAVSSNARFIDVYLSPTITHYLAYRYPNNKFYVVDGIGFCQALTNEVRQKLVELRNDLIDNSDPDTNEISKTDLEDLISNYFDNPKPFIKKQILNKWYCNSEDPEVKKIKPIPEDWEEKLMKFNYSIYFPQNVIIVDSLESLLPLNSEDVIILDEPKINVKEVFEKFKNHNIFTWGSISNNNTTLIDIFGILGLGYTELFSKTRNLKTGQKIDKFVFKGI